VQFFGGPRICIGQQYALTGTAYVIIRLMQRFDGIDNMDTASVVKHNCAVANCSGNGVKVKLHQA
jgi:hypothetical protein